jgi:methionyl-tRNA synthetase
LHLGHAAALLGSDILARYFRLNGDSVLFVSGSDCHGTPIALEAERLGIKPAEIADKYHEEFSRT